MWDPEPREKKLIDAVQHHPDSSDLEDYIRFMFNCARIFHPFSESDIMKRRDYSKILGAFWQYMNQLKCLKDRYTLPDDVLDDLFSLGFEYSKPQKENYKQKLPTSKQEFHAHYQQVPD